MGLALFLVMPGTRRTLAKETTMETNIATVMSARTFRLTPAQHRALAALVEACDQPVDTAQVPARSASPRQIAKRLWPDSPAWEKRTHMRGGRSGAVGGTMPMNAAKLLRRLGDVGFAWLDHFDYTAAQWQPTQAGRDYLAQNPLPR